MIFTGVELPCECVRCKEHTRASEMSAVSTAAGGEHAAPSTHNEGSSLECGSSCSTPTEPVSN